LKISFIIIGFILLACISPCSQSTFKIANGITSDKIRQVRPGMSLEQVIGILGRPFKIDASEGLHNIECKNSKARLEIDINDQTDIKKEVNGFYADTIYCCDGNREDMRTKEVTLTYTLEKEIYESYPMLWIHLDSLFTVYDIYAKQYDGIDDETIYDLSWAIDTTTFKLTNTIDSFIDESKFNKWFKK
jgi:hypothetical protein